MLLRLDQIDPGGALSNRPIRSLRHIFLAWHPATNASLRQRIAALDQLQRQDASVAWKLFVLLLPKGTDFGGDSLKPRFREAGASEREVLTRALVLQGYQEIIRRAVLLAGTIPKRWEEILDLLHAFPINDQEVAINQLDLMQQQMTSDERSSLWQSLNKVIRHHKAHPGANWSLQAPQIERLEEVANKMSPNDPIRESLWLFQRRSPEIQFTSAEKFEEEVERHRRDAVANVWNARGLPGVIELASLVEAPGCVGFSLGHIVAGVEVALQVIFSAFALGDRLQSFVTLFSMVILDRFGPQWQGALTTERQAGKLSIDQLVALVLAWLHRRTTWEYVESFGEETAEAFWRSRRPWQLEGNAKDLEYAVERYLSVDRSELVVEELYPKIRDVSSALILKTLDQFESRIVACPDILRKQAIDFELQQIFAVLQDRTDIPLADIATREYRYLPLLRQHIGARNTSRSLVLDRFMAEDAEFYVSILCDVFRPASERDKDAPSITEEQQARARFGWTLLEGFSMIPGLAGDAIDVGTLNDWVSKVRSRAAERDRLTVAEQKIGNLLAHVPEDPIDHLWPHETIRRCLQQWQADEIERGISIERFNMRGGGARDPKAGGKPEHDLAAEIRTKRSQLQKWPRTQAVLLALAQMWEEMAQREDLRARQEEMRER